MRKFLPIFLLFLFSFTSLLVPQLAYAQPVPPAPQPTSGPWVIDSEVTFIGKNAARSGNMLDWTLLNYTWVCVKEEAGNRNICNNTNNPLAKFWGQIVLYIVIPLLFVVILATAIIIIITRGRSLTIMRFIPRFVAVVLLIVFSYKLLEFFYQFIDLIQGFFLRTDVTKACPPQCISQQDLLYVGWDYQKFIGLRILGDYYAESAFISLLLTKLTALTYFVMVGILLMRKIILWFFIIVSPIFPLLLLYYPVRNTGKIWIGEFFRWLLYAPLFAIFLNGLVFMWRNGIPLLFVPKTGLAAKGDATQIIYPTAVNILLGGPREFVTPTNSVNLTETFALYVVALIMLWIVILLPWILLQIFLDYASNFQAGDSAVMKTLVNMIGNKQIPPTLPAGYPPATPQTGTTINLPFAKKFTIPITLKPAGVAKELTFETATVSKFSQPIFMPSAQVKAQVLSLANLSLPSMRDVARYETALMSNDTSRQQEVSKVRETLERIANPVAVTSTVERDRYTEVHEKLTQESQQGNVLATSILNAASSVSKKSAQATTSQIKSILQQIANPASVTNTTDRERYSKMHDMLSREKNENNSQLASSLLAVSERTSATEIDKIREQLVQAQQQSNSAMSTVMNTITNEQKQSQNINQLRSILQQIANPASVSSAVDKERYTKLHDMLSKENTQNNNQLATSILSVSDNTTVSELEKIKEQLISQQLQGNSVMSSVNSAVQTTQIKKVLQQIANPASVTNITDRERYSKMHDMLSKESKQNNNQLATSILSVNDTTTLTELEKIHDQLMQSKESTIASSVISTINNTVQQTQVTTRVKSVLQQVANPTNVTGADRQKLTKLHEALTKASAEGNTLAASILGVNEKTSTMDIEKLQEKIMEAKEKGVPLATQIASMTQKTTAGSLPVVNRVQTVSQEDYQAVRDMWKENYQNLEVPQGMAGSRAEWIKDDIGKIDNIVGLLSSANQEQVQQGMDEVANILPFLLVGGFSQTEIIAYLKAKQEAAKDVLESISKEEETTVSVETKKAQAQQTMAATMEEASSIAEKVGAATPTFDTTTIVTPQVSNEILAMVNLKLPRMRDIARYETHSLRKDATQTAEVQNMHDMLEKIANPTTVAVGPERERIEKLREKLVEESQKGNFTAEVILSAATSASAAKAPAQAATPVHVKAVLQQIVNPSLAQSEHDRKRFTELRDKLTKADQEGNALAKSILSIKDTTPIDDIERLRTQLKEAKEKGEPLASSVLSSIAAPVSMPSVNRLQTVSPEEFEEVKKMWEENYQNLEVPQGMAGSRAEWIKDDIGKIDNIVGLLSSNDTDKVNEGIQEVSNILPFLLVGGFSQAEITSYLKVKQEAAKEVLTSIAKEEETTVSVETKREEAKQTMTAAIEEEHGQASFDSRVQEENKTAISTKPQIPDEILSLVELKLPKMQDIVRYETGLLSGDKSQADEVIKVRETLEKIANPAPIAIGLERQKFEKLRERLVEESLSGNSTADIILSAVSSVSQRVDKLSATVAEIKTVLMQIANPSVVQSVDDRDFYTQLHDYLARENKEHNSELAGKILSVTEAKAASEIEEIKEDLIKEEKQGNQAAKQTMSAINIFVEMKQIKTVLKHIADPSSAQSSVDREHYKSLHDELSKAGEQGNVLAASLLKVTDSTSLHEIEKLHTNLKEAKQKDEQVAKSVLSAVGGSLISASNRVQPVGQQDFNEVEKMWEENYKNLPVPQGYSNDIRGRVDWIKADITNIEEIVNLFLSTEPDKKNEGLKKVSGILPFLLLGGFSLQEIVSYLKVKLEAAKAVLATLEKDEGNQESVEVQDQKDQKPKEMSAQEESSEKEDEKKDK